jgi:hypothetical protein
VDKLALAIKLQEELFGVVSIAVVDDDEVGVEVEGAGGGGGGGVVVVTDHAFLILSSNRPLNISLFKLLIFFLLSSLFIGTFAIHENGEENDRGIKAVKVRIGTRNRKSNALRIRLYD